MTQRLTIRLSDSLCHQVEAHAIRRGVAASDIVRDALRAYFDTPTPAAPSPAPPPLPASAPAPRPSHPHDCPCIYCRQIRRAAQARAARPEE